MTLSMHRTAHTARLAGAALALSLAPASLLAHPGSGIVVDRLGQVWFMDTGSGLWKIDARGTLVKVTAPRFHWMALDEDDRFASTGFPPGLGGEITPAGARPTLLVASDFPLTISTDGNLYYPARRPGGTAVDITRVQPSGRSAPLATVPLPWLNGLAAAPDGALYYTEDRAIHRVTASGLVSTVASRVTLRTCPQVPGNDPGNPFLRGLAVDSVGNVFVAASGCGSVLKVTPGGQVSTVLQLTPPWSPTAVALHGGNIYVLEYLHTDVEDRLQWLPRVRRISPNGTGAIIAAVTR